MDSPVSPVVDDFVPEEKPRPTKAQVYEFLVECHGNKAKTCREFGLRRKSLEDMINSTPALLQLIEELRESVVDAGESNIFADVLKGDASASRLVVQTLGKNRGWSSAVDLKNSGNLTVEIQNFSGVQSGQDKNQT